MGENLIEIVFFTIRFSFSSQFIKIKNGDFFGPRSQENNQNLTSPFPTIMNDILEWIAE